MSILRRSLILAVVAAAMVPLAAWADDGYPVGTDTPEGAACDFARAFIRRDVALFEQVTLPPFGGGQSRAAYERFLADTKSAIRKESKRPADRGPKEISQVFAARSLGKSGPASYGYATFDFRDVKFVDVIVVLYGGEMAINRTLVVMDKTGRWRVHPAPNIHPLLSDGLNQESASTKEVERKQTPSGLPDDGYPVGTDTPEGAACDFARAFIHHDVALFERVTLPPFGGGQSRAAYERFLADSKSAISKKNKVVRGPLEISKVFAARSLSMSGPASYGYAAFDFQDVKFVDVAVVWDGGEIVTNRTLVIMDKTRRWRVHPAPNIHTLLSAGLDQESPSTKEVERKQTPPGEPREK